MKRVLITGVTGFVGKHTALRFVEEGWEVIYATRCKKEYCSGNGVFIDLNNPETILKLAEQPRCDAIVHLAAFVDFDEEDIQGMYLQNALATSCVAMLAKQWDAYLFYSSTIAVHGVHTQTIEELSPIILDTSYAKTKWLGEMLISSTCIDYGIFRLAGVFGAHGPSHLLLNSTISKAYKGIVPSLYGEGQALRNYIYVKDVANAIFKSTEEKIIGTHLLAGKDLHSIKEMLLITSDVFLGRNSLIYMTGKEGRDQVVKTTKKIVEYHSFKNALIDINKIFENENSFVG